MEPASKLAYRPKEAAEAIGVCEAQLWKLLKERRIRSVKSGRMRLILATDLQAYLAGLAEAVTA